MKESIFNAELKRSLDYHGAYCHKIVDTPSSMLRGMRFTPDKPCDIIGGYKGKYFAIESKQLKKFEAFGVRHLRPSQIKNMNEMVEKGNPAFVFLNIRIPAIKGKQKRENRTIIFEYKSFINMTETLKKKEVEELKYIGYENVNEDIIYNLKEFLGSL